MFERRRGAPLDRRWDSARPRPGPSLRSMSTWVGEQSPRSWHNIVRDVNDSLLLSIESLSRRFASVLVVDGPGIEPQRGEIIPTLGLNDANDAPLATVA